jgi:hypothetical protein
MAFVPQGLVTPTLRAYEMDETHASQKILIQKAL